MKPTLTLLTTKEKQTKVCILHQSQSASLGFEPFAQTPAALCNTHDFEVNLEFEDRRRAAPAARLRFLYNENHAIVAWFKEG